MLFALLAVLSGLVLLVWSAGRFVAGAAAIARHFGVPALLIGMVIVGFGTSAPELVVSILAALQGNPGIALGNAYGSNITNIALILGLTGLISPITVHSQVLRRELPLLSLVSLFAAWQLIDGELSRADGFGLLLVFAAVMAWTLWQGLRQQGRADSLGSEVDEALDATQALSLQRAAIWLGSGLLVLILSSRLLVWGAVSIAHSLGVSDLIIGLTIIAIGTSLPELASSIIAARKGEHDLALGNVLGSNLFNTLAVVGLAGSLHPLQVSHEILQRDISLMLALTFSLFIIGYGLRGPGRINRVEAALLLLSYVLYTGYLVHTVLIPGATG